MKWLLMMHLCLSYPVCNPFLCLHVTCYDFSLNYVQLLSKKNLLAREYPEIVYSLDIWHKAKKLRKK